MLQEPVKADSISRFRERLDKFMDNTSVNGTKRMYPLTFLIHVHAWELLWERTAEGGLVLIFLLSNIACCHSRD